MAKFTFRLQTLLNVKEQIEKNIKNEMGIAIQKLERQKNILEEIRTSISTHADEYRQEGTERTTLFKLKQRLEYIKHMQKEERRQQQRVNEEQRNVDKVRRKLVDVMKEKKMLEKLREKEHIAFKKEQDKSRRVFLDELVSYSKYEGNTEEKIKS